MTKEMMEEVEQLKKNIERFEKNIKDMIYKGISEERIDGKKYAVAVWEVEVEILEKGEDETIKKYKSLNKSDLEGSEKQIKWANDIRDKRIEMVFKNMNSFVFNLDRDSSVLAEYLYKIKQLKLETSSAIIIENRYN